MSKSLAEVGQATAQTRSLNKNKNQFDHSRGLAPYNPNTFNLFYHSMPAMSVPLCSLTLTLPDEAATDALARQFAPLVSGATGQPPGGRIHLQGDLGAGKTAFTRALLRECGIQGRIKSPSYALLESYKVSNLYFYHFDFYRFNDSREWLDAGFRDLLREDAVVLIEWPERAEGVLPPPDMQLSLVYADPGRVVTLTAFTARGQTWLNAIAPPPQTPCLPTGPAGDA